MSPKFKDNYPEFKHEVDTRGINKLVHFTPTVNLLGMMDLGKIVNREQLEKIGENHIDFLLDYTQMTDDYRFDDPSYINLSIEHPNTFLLNRFQQKTKDKHHIQWCVLEVDVEPIYWTDTRFSVTNAASNAAKSYGIGSGLEHFKNMFNESITVKNRTLKRNNLSSRYPTDVQAEILVKNEIGMDRVHRIAFQNKDDLLLAKAAVTNLDSFNLTVDINLFQSR